MYKIGNLNLYLNKLVKKSKLNPKEVREKNNDQKSIKQKIK